MPGSVGFPPVSLATYSQFLLLVSPHHSDLLTLELLTKSLERFYTNSLGVLTQSCDFKQYLHTNGSHMSISSSDLSHESQT